MNNKTIRKRIRLRITRLFSIIFAIMLVVSLFTGISVLAEQNAFKLDTATITDKSDTVTGDINKVSNDKVKDNVTFHRVNDDVTYKLVIKNNLDKEITILSITDDNDNDYITYEYDKHNNEKLGAGDSFDFLVTTRYNSSVTDMSKRDQNISTNFIINYLLDGEEKSDSINDNPATGDNITWSFIIFIISSTGLIVCIALDRRNSHKKFDSSPILCSL